MFKESLYNFFSVQVTRFEETIKTPAVFETEESIHIIRVCLKKMKTLLTFFERLQIPGFNLKQAYKKERILFNTLGKLREIDKQYIQVNQYELKRSSSINEFIDFLQKNEKKERKKLAKVDLDDIMNHLKTLQQNILEIIDMYEDIYLYDEAMLFIDSEFGKIRSLKNNLDNYSNWHFVRKCLKNNMYIMSIIIDSHQNTEVTMDTLSEIDKLQDSIGNWHDEIVAFEFLSKFINKQKKQNH